MTSSTNHVTLLGHAHRRATTFPFGIRLADRLLHLYVVGQTGTGKSTLLANLARQDAEQDTGFCLIDPHGDLALKLRGVLPPGHLYWDVADPACPLGYNPLTRASAPFRPLIASGLIDALKKQWADAWGVRMEHLLRYAILALLEQSQADLRDIMRLFLDKPFRQTVIARLTDPQVRQFWTVEYPTMKYTSAADGVAPIANKLGAFLAHPLVRRAICDPAEPLRLRRLMDDSGTLIVNLGKGRLGADTANVLGGLLIASLMNAALSRQDAPEAERRPFMLYVDEFHSFTTAAFATLLSEIRKYGVGVIIAQQYLAQSDRAVFEAIIGNVGSLMAFRVGALDAPAIATQLGAFTVKDLVNLPNYRAYLQMMVDGTKTRPFSVTTAPWRRPMDGPYDPK